MSISREEFDKGRIELTVPVLWVLQELAATQPQQAFTAAVVYQEFRRRLRYRATTVGEVAFALESLHQQGKIQRREIAGERYYNCS
jgi:hypothetical protein